MPLHLPHRRTVPALLVAGVLVVSAGVGGATAGALITGRDIADRSITSVDIANRTLGTSEISREAIASLRTRWIAGNGVPDDETASRGTWYLDRATGDTYKKTASGWEIRANIKGAPGAMGASGATAATGPAGPAGSAGPQGLQGQVGPAGPTGDTGAPGAPGMDGVDGTDGIDGTDGAPGADGFKGQDGAPGADGVNAVVAYAEFFALAPPNNANLVAPGTDVSFPQDGPTSGPITRLGPDSFKLANIGTYRVSFSVPVDQPDEPGQLVVTLNDVDLDYTVVGRATGTSPIAGESLVETTTINSVLTVRNPAGNPQALTVTPFAGGPRPVASTLIIEQLG